MRQLLYLAGFLFLAAFWFNDLGEEPAEPAQRAASKTHPTSGLVEPIKAKTVTQPYYMFVTASRLNLRDAPNASAKKLGGFDLGSKLAVLSQRNGWARVNGTSGGVLVSGWVSAQYLARSVPARVSTQSVVAKRSIAAPSSGAIAKAKRALIAQSIAAYPGTCPCEYSRNRAGRRCGRTSAWSKPGGYEPLCYESDVTRSHLKAFFARQGKSF